MIQGKQKILDVLVTVQPRTLHSAAKFVRKRIGWNASSHHEVVMHGLMIVTGKSKAELLHVLQITDKITLKATDFMLK